MTMTNFRSTDMNLLHENLTRARMPQPHGEAHRSEGGARRVAMRARARQAHELGEMPQFDGR
jgi:hypothetical protein